MGEEDSNGCRGLRWSPKWLKNSHGFAVVWVFLCSRRWVFWGRWRDSSEGSTSSTSCGSKVPGSSRSLAWTPQGSPLQPDHWPRGKNYFFGGGGGLGGKTSLPAHDLLQMPFAESFKTESDQLRFANERPDGWGGGVGGKEPHGLRQQVVSRSRDGGYSPSRALAPLPLLA